MNTRSDTESDGVVDTATGTGDADADTDADADADTDTDADADGDADTGSGGDTGSDTDTGTGSDTSTDNISDTNTDTEAVSGTDSDSDSSGDTGGNGDTSEDTETGSETAGTESDDIADTDTGTGSATVDEDTESSTETSSSDDTASEGDTGTDTGSGGDSDTQLIDTDGCPNGRLHVSPDGEDSRSGDTWSEAKRTLQVAMDLAAANDCDVWVAAGTYLPTMTNSGSGDRFRTFMLREGVAVYGGFAGLENELTERSVTVNRTILSGDIGASDVRGDNAYHVVTGADDAVLDGFTITGGYDDTEYSRGGGMLNLGVSPTVQNCVFLDNEVVEDDYWSSGVGGGGMFNESASPVVTNCLFIGNRATGTDYWYYATPRLSGGGGIFNEDSAPVITDCTFVGNASLSPLTPNSGGGGVLNSNSASTLEGCVFSNNRTLGYGGGLLDVTSTSVVSDTFFVGNAADEEGGAVMLYESPAEIANSLFAGNLAGSDDCYTKAPSSCGNGGALSTGPASVTNCTFYGNVAVNGGAVSGAAVVSNSILWGDRPNEMNNVDALSHSIVQDGDTEGFNTDEDPEFVGNPLCTGQGWSSVTYDENAFTTHLTTADPCWDGDVSGLLVKPSELLTGGDPAVARFLIDDNTEDTLIVMGNIQAEALGGEYEIHDLRIGPRSPAVDRADDASAPPEDIVGQPRMDIADAGPDGSVADIGAYEYQGD